MRIRWQAVATLQFCLWAALAATFADEVERHEPEIDIFASMAGKCSTLKIADRNFACTNVAFSHSPGGRSAFTVPLNDPDDETHIVTFSGENGKRDQDNKFEISLDQVLLKSKDRPKLDGLPIPSVKPSTGTCKQLGNFAMQQVSSISCTAADEEGKKYELQFVSDGSPIKVQMIRTADPAAEERRATILNTHMVQLKCRQMAELQGILPRDRTAFILKCMDE